MAEYKAKESDFIKAGYSKARAKSLTNQINSLHTNLRRRYVNTAVEFKKRYGSGGYDLDINQAARTSAQQKTIKATGVKAASPGNTWHTVGGAADFSIYKDGKLDKGMAGPAKNPYVTKLQPVAAEYGLANPISNDVGHFMPTEFPKARRGATVEQYVPTEVVLGGAAGKALEAVKTIGQAIADPFGSSTLKVGVPKSARVQKLQETLAKEGFDIGPKGADGFYGEDTAKAVAEYQAANGLKPDGVVGKNTREMLNGTIQKQQVYDVPTRQLTVDKNYTDPFGVQRFQEARTTTPAPGVGPINGMMRGGYNPAAVASVGRANISTPISTSAPRGTQHEQMVQSIKDGWSAKGAAVRAGLINEPPTPRLNPRFQTAAGGNSVLADPSMNRAPDPAFDARFGPGRPLGRGTGVGFDADILSKYSGNGAVSAPASKQAPATIGSSARSSAGATSVGAVSISDLVRGAQRRATAAVKDLPTNAGTGGGVSSQVGYGGTGSAAAQKAAVGDFQQTGKPSTGAFRPVSIEEYNEDRKTPTSWIKPKRVQTTSIKQSVPISNQPAFSAPKRALTAPAPAKAPGATLGGYSPTALASTGRANISTIGASAPIPRANSLIAPRFTSPPVNVPAYKVTSPVGGPLAATDIPASMQPAYGQPVPGQPVAPVAPAVEEKPFIDLPAAAKLALGVAIPGIGIGISALNKIMGAGFKQSRADWNKSVAANVQKSDMIGGNYGGASYGRKHSDGSVRGTTQSGTGYTSRNDGRDISVGGREYTANKNRRGYSQRIG